MPRTVSWPPGWVDLHSHSDLTLLSDGRARRQGRAGRHHRDQRQLRDGWRAAPAGGRRPHARRPTPRSIPTAACPWEWTDLAGYVRALHDTGLAINTAPLIGHLTLRIAIAGEAARPLDDAERRALVGRDRRLPRRRRDGRVDGADVPAGDVGGLRGARRRSAGRSRGATGCSRSHMRNYSDRPARRGDRGARGRAGERVSPPDLAPGGRRPAQLGQGAARARADRGGTRRRRRCRRGHLSVHRRQREPLAAPSGLGAGRRSGRHRRALVQRRGAPEDPGGLAREPVLRLGRGRGLVVRAAARGDARDDGRGRRRPVVHGSERDRARADRTQRQPRPDGRLRPIRGRPARRADPPSSPRSGPTAWPWTRRTVVRGPAASAIVRLLPASPRTVRPRRPVC